MTITINTCVQCLKEKKESSFHYFQRIKKGLDSPFYCQRCRKHPIPYEEILIKRTLPNKIESMKSEIKSLIRNYQTSNLMKDQEISLKKSVRQKRAEYQKGYLQTESGKISYEKGWKKRRLNLKKALEGIPEDEIDLVKEFYSNRPIGYEIDHIIPISRGGKHRLDNLRYIKSEDHRDKYNKIDREYIKYALDNDKFSISSLMRNFGLERESATEIYHELKCLF
jgi:5-methylcytosine-specific restriction endonuclease McrA